MSARLSLLTITILLTVFAVALRGEAYVAKPGDILFQSLPHNDLVDAIEGVSKSDFSHCGIVVNEGGELKVLEALGTVHFSPIDDWLRRGRKGKFTVCRFKNSAQIDPEKLIAAARLYLGAEYDIHYSFQNDEIYCSELVFLAYKKLTGQNLGIVRKLGAMNWRPYENFIRKVENGNLPLDREMITPFDLSRAAELELVYSK